MAVFPVPPLAELTAPGGVGEGARRRPGDAGRHGAGGAGGDRAAGERDGGPPGARRWLSRRKLSVSPLGTDTTRPLGRASVNATPVSVVSRSGW